jgi:hypothetical protein
LTLRRLYTIVVYNEAPSWGPTMPTLDEIARTFPGVRVFRLADDGRHRG